MIDEVRRVCGITAAPAVGTEEEADEAAADVQAGTSPLDEAEEEELVGPFI